MSTDVKDLMLKYWINLLREFNKIISSDSRVTGEIRKYIKHVQAISKDYVDLDIDYLLELKSSDKEVFKTLDKMMQSTAV